MGILDRKGVIYTNIYPRIIDDTLFKQVQKMCIVKKRLSAKGKAKVEYLLTGKAFCGHCGSTIIGVSGKIRNGETNFRYYACRQKYNFKKCNKGNERKDELEKLVVADTIAFISKPQNIENAARKLAEYHEQNITTQKIREYEKRIATIDREIEKLIDALIGIDGNTLRAKINQRAKDFEIQRNDLSTELAKLRYLSAQPKTANDYKKRIQDFTNGDLNDKEYQKKIIHGLVNSIWLFDGGMFVFYNFDKADPITIDELKSTLKENSIDYDKLCSPHIKSCGGLEENRTPICALRTHRSTI